MAVPKNDGPLVGSPQNKNHSILGSMLGLPIFQNELHIGPELSLVPANVPRTMHMDSVVHAGLDRSSCFG